MLDKVKVTSSQLTEYKCKYCREIGLVLSTINNDYVCEYCGKWQDALLNDVYEIIEVKAQ